MQYQHKWADNTPIHLPAGKAVCVGRNYADHAKELNNPVPEEPLLFIKPASSFISFEQGVQANYGSHPVHYETEIVLLMDKPLKNCSPENAVDAIAGIGIAMDLTLRDLQTVLKNRGHPWEKAKAFDGACVISPFTQVSGTIKWDNISFYLLIDGKPRQKGNSADMLMPIPDLVSHISRFFSLYPGDMVLTGTPAGVGQLKKGESLIAGIDNMIRVEGRVE